MPSGKPTQLTACATTVVTPGRTAQDREPEYIRREAKAFLETMWTELNIDSAEIEQRCWEVDAEIARTGSYRHTLNELEFGARLAWRNHTRCIGKLYWRTLTVRDCRNVTSGPAIRDALVEHLRLAGNGGRIKPMLTVFAPQTPGSRVPIVLNDQLLKYAGYAQPDGSVVGDPTSVALTAEAQRLGWQGPGGRFDFLPVVIEMGNETSMLLELPSDVTVDVALQHPTYEWFGALGLRWYQFPTVSNLTLEIGGVTYPMAPFSGWYVASEIGARDLADQGRYDMLPTIAKQLGLDTSSNKTLWKDRALIELNIAVLWTFDRAGIRMVDHHTMADQFHRFTTAERRAGRTVNAEWSWIVPPMSPSATPVYHMSYNPQVHLPNFFRRTDLRPSA